MYTYVNYTCRYVVSIFHTYKELIVLIATALLYAVALSKGSVTFDNVTFSSSSIAKG